MATGPMQFGADNNAGPNQPNQTVLRAQNSSQATLVVRNEGPAAGNGLEVVGGPVGVEAIADAGPDGFGIQAEGGTGILADSTGSGNGVIGRSPQRNGVQGESSSPFASGVYGENNGGGYGVAGRTRSSNNSVAGVLGESTGAAPQGFAAGVYGYSENGYGGIFITGQAGGNAPFANSGALRVVGEIVKSQGEYSEALPHPDGSQRLLYAPLSPESWYEDFGRAELVAGQAEVELDTDFAAVLGIEDGSYHVFLTPEGDTGALYVSSRNARAFTVREQQGGASNASFSYRVVAKNNHRQPERLARLEEPEELTKQRQLPGSGL
jgi:hypothetical protein